MKKLSNTEAELKKKACHYVITYRQSFILALFCGSERQTQSITWSFRYFNGATDFADHTIFLWKPQNITKINLWFWDILIAIQWT